MDHVRTPTPLSDRTPPTPSGRETLFEFLAGPLGAVALILVGILILREHAWTITAKDAVYWAVVGGMIAARFAIQRERQGVPRFLARVIPAAGLGWVLAQSFRV